ncbi:S-adenosyl-L-methionine-dependent methyltransferase [Xylariaceae sp. FL0016]|nr:S-adenosyl-L-methionine-dependent methyltransferase [Xylariaceae sp. FL0016]
MKLHDVWLQQFLEVHQAAGTPVTVLCLGCGLDGRNLRVNTGKEVRWVDVDTAEVVELRRKLMPALYGDYMLLAAEMTDGKWIRDIPADRPTYIVAEELLMWLDPKEGKQLLRKLVHHLPEGQLGTDMIGSVIKELSWLMPLMKGTKVKFKWAINDGRDIEALSRRLRIRDTVRWYEMLGAEKVGEESPRFFGKWTSVATHIPGFKSCAQVVLFDFGDIPGSRTTTDSGSTHKTDVGSDSTSYMGSIGMSDKASVGHGFLNAVVPGQGYGSPRAGSSTSGSVRGRRSLAHSESTRMSGSTRGGGSSRQSGRGTRKNSLVDDEFGEYLATPYKPT